MSLTRQDGIYLESLRTPTKSTLREIIGSSPKEIIYLDTPRHRNLGDSLIWRGSMDYLHRLGHRVVYHTDMGRFRDSDLRKVSSSSVILLHGGGNFGSLYPLHDEFRRHIVTSFPARRIVVMPQSIYYSDEGKLRQAVQQYRQAKNLTILLRESRSMNIAAENMSDLDFQFCYDSALGAELEMARDIAHNKVLVLARADAEGLPHGHNVRRVAVDWSWTRLNGAKWNFYKAIGAAFRRLPTIAQDRLYPVSQHANEALLGVNMRAALNQFSDAAVVATDRLHAHILSILLGIPHVVSDNSYGKISGIYNEYTGNFTTANWAKNMDEAAAKAYTMLAHHASGEARQ